MVTFRHKSVVFATLFALINVACSSSKISQLIPLELFDAETYGKSDVAQIHNVWARAALQKRPDQVSNLNDVITPLQSKHTFSVINNYFGLDIGQLEHPIILRKPLLFVIDQGRDTYAHRWIRKPVPITDGTGWRSLTLCQDEFLQDPQLPEIYGNLTREYCLSYDYFLLSVSSKQWYEIIDVDLYYPIQMQKEMYDDYLPVFRYNITYSYYNFLPSSCPNIHVLILGELKLSYDFQLSVVKWAQDRAVSKQQRHRSRPTNSRDVYMYMFINLVTKNVSKVHMFLPCFQTGCFQTREIKLGELTKLANLETITSGLFSPQNMQLPWASIKVNYLEKPAIRGVLRNLEGCGILLPSTRYLTSGSVDKLDRVYLVIASLLQTIMGNFSFYMRNEKLCKNGIVVDEGFALDAESPFLIRIDLAIEPKGKSHMHRHMLVIDNRLLRLRIIASGRRGLKELPFQELLNVYDIYVWISIASAISILAASLAAADWGLRRIASSKLIPKSKILEQLFCLVKALLEQGDPFAAQTLIPTSLRWIVASFLLAALVLSNGYKNNNVYNMIVPREPVLYKTFKQLTENHFNIFTRALYVSMSGAYDKAGFHSWRMHRLEVEYIGVYSEVYDARRIYGPFSPVEEIMNHSILHPNISTLIQHISSGIVPLLRVFYPTRTTGYYVNPANARVFEDVVVKLFRERERQWLENELNECNKSAILVPEYISYDYVRKLKRSEQYSNISIVDDVFAETELDINILGYTPPYFLARLNRFHESYIFQWSLDTVQSNSSLEVQSSPPPKPASLKGNVSLIFYVQFVGLAASIANFVIEVRRTILRVAQWIALFIIDIILRSLKNAYFLLVKLLRKIRTCRFTCVTYVD